MKCMASFCFRREKLFCSFCALALFAFSCIFGGLIKTYRSPLENIFAYLAVFAPPVIIFYCTSLKKEKILVQGSFQSRVGCVFKVLSAWIILFGLNILATQLIYSQAMPSEGGGALEGSDVQVLLMCLNAAFIAPLIEELLFRRVLFSLFSATFGKILGAILSSALFALLHSPALASFYAFFCGLVLCLLYGQTGKIKYPFFLHSFNNVLSLIFVFL